MPSIRPTHVRRRSPLIAAVVAAAALAAPVAADAAYTSTDGGGNPVMTGDVASDTLVIGVSGANLTHNRPPAEGFNSNIDFDSTTAGDQPVPNTATVTVNAGGGDDAVTSTAPAAPMVVHGDDGDDTIITSDPVDNLFGNAGNDRITGGKGNDVFSGGAGNDQMVWNNGDNNDTMEGDGNTDEVEVNGATNAGDIFTIKPNGSRVRFDRTNLVPFFLDINSERIAVNGLGGADSITGDPGLAPLILTTLNGGVGNDTITGGDGPDLITGGDGNDTLSGGSSDDRIVGDRGDDTMAGDGGDDTLVWNNGDNNDKMDGADGLDRTEVNGSPTAGDAFVVAPNGQRVKFDRTNLVPFSLDIGTTEALQLNTLGGNDSITANPGAGSLIGINVDSGSGDDTVAVRDSAVTLVRCGDNADSVTADAVETDEVSADCESVDRSASPDRTGTPVAIGAGRVKVTGRLRKATAPIRLTCPAAETGGCKGKLTLLSAGALKIGRVKVVAVLGGANYTLKPGERKTVKVKLPSTLKSIAGRKKTLKVRASTLSRDSAGNVSESTRRLTLTLPRK